jgi:hypothetical protein
VRRHALTLAFVLWNLFGSLAHAGDRCRGDCHGAGLAVLILMPLPIIFAYFWGRKTDGPDLGQVLAYVIQSGVIGVCAAYALMGLAAPRWSAWMALGIVQYSVFALLIHPRRHPAQR